MPLDFVRGACLLQIHSHDGILFCDGVPAIGALALERFTNIHTGIPLLEDVRKDHQLHIAFEVNRNK